MLLNTYQVINAQRQVDSFDPPFSQSSFEVCYNRQTHPDNRLLQLDFLSCKYEPRESPCNSE